MSELLTKKTKHSVKAFLDSIEDEQKRKDCIVISKLLRKVSGKRAFMWGSSIVGFGEYHYQYKSGREGDWPVIGFSPRMHNLTIYIMPGFSCYRKLLAKLGKHKTSSSCLYVKRLSDIDLSVLEVLMAQSIQQMAEIYECK